MRSLIPEIAEQLLENGLSRSAVVLLDTLRIHTQAINSLRARARRCAQSPMIRPGIYTLVTYQDLGLVLPLRAEVGHPRTGSPMRDDASRAVLAAQTLSERHIDSCSRKLPSLRLLCPVGADMYGRSIGLGAALAFLAKWMGRPPRLPVLVTGRLSPEGDVLPVGGLEAKLAAALRELEGTEGLVVIPCEGTEAAHDHGLVRPVPTLAEAIMHVWDDSNLVADPRLLRVSDALVTTETERDYARAIATLEAYLTEDLPSADQARLLFRLGTLSRHLGRTAEASCYHETAMELMELKREVLGPETFETLEIEKYATDVDCYVLETLEARLRRRLNHRFTTLHNKVRCRGILAQLLSTLGKDDEAVVLREENLRAQQETDEMRREIPRTLAYLVHETARQGNAILFDRYAARLLLETPPGDLEQHRYNARALALGLVLLGRHGDLTAWIRGHARLWDQDAHPELVKVLGQACPIDDYPEVATARALVRALRRTGRSEEAVKVASRVQCDPGRPLVEWLAGLTRVEGALAELDLGRNREAERLLSKLEPLLRKSHPPAAAFHAPLLQLLSARPLDQGRIKELERMIDKVYY